MAPLKLSRSRESDVAERRAIAVYALRWITAAVLAGLVIAAIVALI